MTQSTTRHQTASPSAPAAAPASPSVPSAPAAGSASPSAADPLSAFLGAVALAVATLDAVRPDQYDLPTPCEEYDVRELARHIVAVLRRFALVGRGGDPMTLPHVADGSWHEAADEARAAWTADPGLLDRPVTLPFGTLPGAAALVVYAGEFTVHTWDLAVATGQSPAWDPAVLAVSLGAMERALPAERRGGGVPFGPVVETAPDAPAVDRLVAWYGRRP
ncbi:TIGR03086 family metal-binding protein [Streptomyces sp. NPDC085614]|uniref:TIGR03086 family metal-binding protein n=1 Tax=Streptomyces sp. NPDC085614 TaxID=3365733 RepID=UPI0037D30B43